MTNNLNSVRARKCAPGLASTCLALAAVLAFGTTKVFAIGFRIPNQDPEAIAAGNAFVATANNPSALYYNPAGITQLEGQQASIGILNYFGINTHYKSPGGKSSDTDFEMIPVPELYYTYSPKDSPLSFGIGAFAPFGLGVVWPEDTGFRSLAIESRMTFLTVNPVVAWKVHPTLSLAIGPTINYSKVKFTRGLAAPTDYFEFKGSDFSFGFQAGLLWQPHAQWSFGVNYRSSTTMNYEGDSKYNPGITIPPAATTAKVAFPQIITAGASYRPTPDWNFEFDVDYSDWDTLNTVTLEGTSNLGFPIDLPLQLDWKGSWLFEFGVTRQLKNGWWVGAGYFYCTETAPNETFTPAIPDTVLHVGSVGFGHKGQRWQWAVAAQIIAGPTRKISGNQGNPFTGENANGGFQLVAPTISVSVGYRF
jgi:long-chain fatty acid transport protein